MWHAGAGSWLWDGEMLSGYVSCSERDFCCLNEVVQLQCAGPGSALVALLLSHWNACLCHLEALVLQICCLMGNPIEQLHVYLQAPMSVLQWLHL